MLGVHTINAFEALGAMVSDKKFDERISMARTDNFATIVYTSRSTDAPKGAELTHHNFTNITRATQYCIPDVINGESRLLLFLPLAHCFACMIQYFTILSDEGVGGYLPSIKTLLRMFEKVHNATTRKADAGWKGRMFAKAAEAAINWSKMQQYGEKPTAKQRTERAVYETTVYRTIRSDLGSRIKYPASGGVSISLDLLHFYNGIGLTMTHVYSLTKAAAPFMLMRSKTMRSASLFRPSPDPPYAS